MAGKFEQGKSGNPTGRPRGIKDKRFVLRELLKPHAENLVKRAVELAMAGDTTALRICIDRLIPPVKEGPVRVSLPKITCAGDCTNAQAAVLNAVAAGEMLPGEGEAVSGLIDAQRRAYETTELTKRLEAIEAHMRQKGVTP